MKLPTKKKSPGTSSIDSLPFSDGEMLGVEEKPERAPLGISASQYATLKRRLMNLINEIRSAGAALDVDLPVIVVIGNQSSGKSSLIEAFSGVCLPRAAGTCTRVPMEVRLMQTAGQSWKCQIWLRFETDQDGTVRCERNLSFLALKLIRMSVQPLSDVEEKPFGPAITDPAEVEAALRRAQLAILNPSVPMGKFVDYDLPAEPEARPLGSTKQLPFSTNVVCLKVTGPEVADLTIIDLPGIISSVGPGEDPKNIEIVTNLSKHYMKKDCLILTTITMKDDIDNQSCVMLAREVDPEGKRTIGVLTKVDTVHAGEVGTWVRVFKNISHPLIHKYYITRQPNAEELASRLSFEEARERERVFFATNAPWNGMEPEWRKRQGTKNLVDALSNLLMTHIKQRLPALNDKIDQLFNDTCSKIKGLPAPPSDDPSSEMLQLVNAFVKDVQAYTEGGSHFEELIQDLNCRYTQFRQQIWTTAPRFAPFTLKELTDKSESGTMTYKPVEVDYLGEACGREIDMGPGGRARDAMNLDDIRQHIDRSKTRELPNNVPFRSIASLIEKSLLKWHLMAMDTFASIEPVLNSLLHKLAEEHFGKYTEGMLLGTATAILRDQLTLLANTSRARLERLLELENRPYTQNHHYFNANREKFVAQLKEKRDEVLGPRCAVSASDYQEAVQEALANLTRIGITGLNEADLKKLRGADGYEEELEVMAETRAYYQVAFTRIIDNVPRLLDADLVIPLGPTMHQALIKELSVSAEGGRERCRAFLAESQIVARQREELNNKKARLGKARDAIRTFGM